MRMDSTQQKVPDTAPEDPVLLTETIIVPSLEECALLLRCRRHAA